MKYDLNKKEITYQVEGKRIFGNETVLLHRAVDLTQGKSWGGKGFTIEKFSMTSCFHVQEKTKELLISLWKESGLPIDENLELDQYHAYANKKNTHLNVVDKTKLLFTSAFPIPIQVIGATYSEICGAQLIAKKSIRQSIDFSFPYYTSQLK